MEGPEEEEVGEELEELKLFPPGSRSAVFLEVVLDEGARKSSGTRLICNPALDCRWVSAG